MATPVPNLTKRRWQADFQHARVWKGGVLQTDIDKRDPILTIACDRPSSAVATAADGSTTSFAPGVARATDRGATFEPYDKQLLTNSRFSGAVVGSQAPDNWVPSGSMLVTPVEITQVGALHQITVDCTFVNATGAAIGVRIALELGGGIFIADLPREFVFHGSACVVSSSNTSAVTVRLVGRDGSGNAVGEQSPQILAAGTEPQPFFTSPTIDAAATRVDPAITWSVAAGTTGTVRLTLRGLKLGSGKFPTSYIASSPSSYAREPDRYVNPTLAGVVDGTPGTLPQYWSQNSMSSYRIYPSAPGEIDIELTNIASPSATTNRSILLCMPTGGEPGQILAEAGQRWVGGIECTVIADPNAANARLNVAARDVGGAQLGASVSTTFPALGTLRREATLTILPAGTASLMLSVITSAAAGTTSVVRLRLREPRANLLVPTPGVSGVRERDAAQSNQPALFAGPATVAIEAELTALAAGAVLLSIWTGSGHKLNVIAGTQLGVIVSKPGTDTVQSLQPLYAAPGVTRLVIAYRAGHVSVAYGDAGEGRVGEIDVPGFDPSTISRVYIANDNGANGMITTLRRIDIDEGVRGDLALATRDEWAPRHFVQVRPGLIGPDIESVAPFSPPANVVAGESQALSMIGNRYWRRNHTSAITDSLPAANSIGSVEGTPQRIYAINDSAFPMRINATAGNVIYPPYEDPNAPTTPLSYVIVPPGMRILLAADGYDPATKNWIASNEQWWYQLRPLDGLLLAYNFASIYGPPDPANPNRSIIFPPAYCAYNSDIGPIRQISTAAVQKMNRWIYYGSQLNAAEGLRYLRDACAADYWRDSIGITTITALKSQINSTGFAYLGLRDARVGTAADHQIIREWFRTRMDQTIEFFKGQIGAGRISPGVWASTSTGRGNHVQQAGLAAAVCACILDRADYLEFAWDVFRSAVQDAADVPGSVGALPLEMRRAQKSLQYQNLALGAMAPLAEILERFGLPAYAYLDGEFIKMVNFSIQAIDDPSIVTAEQARMISLGAPWSTGIVSVTQEPIGVGQDTDPSSGELLPNESRSAWGFGPFRRLTDEQAPWRVIWAPRYGVYLQVYAGGIGGAQSYLYRYPGIAIPVPPDE